MVFWLLPNTRARYIKRRLSLEMFPKTLHMSRYAIFLRLASKMSSDSHLWMCSDHHCLTQLH